MKSLYIKSLKGLGWQVLLTGLIYATYSIDHLAMSVARIALVLVALVVVFHFHGPLMKKWVEKGAQRDTERVIARMRARGDFNRNRK